MADVKVAGLEDLKRAVEELTADLRKRVIIGALKDAAQPIVKAAKATTAFNDRTGSVRRNIRVAASKVFQGKNGVIGVYVNVRVPKARRIKGTKLRVKAKQNDPYYWKFLELGTKKMRAHPFLKPAAEANFTAALDIFKTQLAARIVKANKRKT